MRTNPKGSSKQGRTPKPPKPVADKVKAEDIDHSAGAEDAVALADDSPETVAGGAFDPKTEDPKPAGPKSDPKKEPVTEELDPGKSHPPKYKRGVAPGERITY